MSSENAAFIVLSINHETVPLEIREQYSLETHDIERLYQQLRHSGLTNESLVLNTCNRFELYAQLRSVEDMPALLSQLSAFYGQSEAELTAQLKTRTGREAVQHLIEVSAGLRSQITGEAEIFGQVKNAYSESRNLGYAGKIINRVFQKGFQAAKHIRHHTQIGEGQISIANVAVELASKIYGSLEDAYVLSIGTGDIGEKTLKALRSRGAKRFGVASRSMDRAAALAQNWSGEPLTVSELESYLPSYDIVISSIGAEEPILTEELLRSCLARRQERPLFLIDLGLPRNIEHTCGAIDNVFLYNLDDLAAIAEENLAERRKALTASQSIAAQKSAHIWESVAKLRA